MGKRALPTIFALAVFIGLFVWVNLYEVEPIPEPGQDNPVDLTIIDPSEVKALVWKTPGRPDLRVETSKEGEQTRYELVQPRKLRGEDGEFGGILSRFENLRSTRTISTNATDTKVFGLGSESPSLTLETATRSVTLTLGDQHPIGNAFYLTRSGDPAVYLVGGDVQPAFRKTVDELRAKNLFTEDFTGFNQLAITNPSEAFKLEKGKDGNWNLLQPREMAADNSAVSNLIFGIRDLRVSRFIEDLGPEKASGSGTPELDAQALGRYGLEKPEARLVLGTGSGAIVLTVGKEDNGERFVKRDGPVVYAIPAAGALSTLLSANLDQLRNKDLPGFDRSKVTSLDLKTASGSFKLERNGQAWEFDGRKLEMAKANSLFDGWTTNRIQQFRPAKDLEAAGLSGEKVEQLKIGLGTESLTITFGKVENGQVSAQMGKGISGEEIWQLPVALYDAFKNLYEAAKAAPPPVPAASAGVQSGIASESKTGAATPTVLPAAAGGATATPSGTNK